MELNIFQNEFRDLANKFNENEKIIQRLEMRGNCLEEVNTQLDKLDCVMEAMSVDALKAKKLAKAGQQLIAEHAFARDCLEPKCFELKMMCKKQEVLFLERRGALLKFLDLFDGLENMSKWYTTVTQHLNRDQDMDQGGQDIFSQIRQIDYLLSKSRDLKIRSRVNFEEDFDDIKDLISPKTLFMVDDKLNLIAEVKQEVIDRRDMLREKASKDPNISTACENNDDLAVR